MHQLLLSFLIMIFNAVAIKNIQRNTINTNAANDDVKKEVLKIVVTANSIPNGVHEKELPEAHNVQVKNYLQTASENILDKIENYKNSTCKSKGHHKKIEFTQFR